MSDKYYGIDGNETTLEKLCKSEPAWSANVIRTLKQHLASARREGWEQCQMEAIISLCKICPFSQYGNNIEPEKCAYCDKRDAIADIEYKVGVRDE